MKNLQRIIFITFAALLAFSLAALSGCNKRAPSETVRASPLSAADKEAAFLAEPASRRIIKINFSGSLCQGVIAMAQHKGFFAAEGLKTELIRTSGTDNTRDALAGGKIDTAAGMIAGWLKPVINGVDIRFTVGLHTGCTSGLVLADSDITGFRKGQTVAVSDGIGNARHNIAYRFISHDGFKPEDFVWRDFPADQILLVLKNGQADVAVIDDQLASKWVLDGTLRRIRSLHHDDDFKEESCCVMGIAGAFFDQNPVASEKISRAVYRASKWIEESEENKWETVNTLLENGYITSTAEYAFHLLKLYRYGLSNELTERTLYKSVEEYQALGVIGDSFNADDVKKQIWHPLDIEGN